MPVSLQNKVDSSLGEGNAGHVSIQLQEGICVSMFYEGLYKHGPTVCSPLGYYQWI